MNVISAIRNRHSYRGKYKSDPVPREDLIQIMEAGLAAPSGCNKQTTSLICVEYWPQFIASAPFQLLWHYVCTWLYRRYGNIFGSTVMHGCVDMSMGIFG